MGPTLTRRQAILAVTAAAATMYGRETVTAGQRTLVLPLDGLAGIEVRLGNGRVLVRSEDILQALSAKEA